MEQVGYVLLSIVVIIWIVGIFIGLISVFPFGIIGLIAIAGIGLLLIKVLTDRFDNKEDNYYSKNVDK
ncbi:MAG: hypothetical protein HND52_06870 [Ignavibacteriae bacterium]|nr:hypothetical protein [Ignavibacteriota bacterium]NOG97665.1 hypothetical protein [Ignavibacteriota bacterium]